MRRLFLAVLLALLLVPSGQSHTSIWNRAIKRIEPSLAYLTRPGGACTAFSINQEQGYYLTAYHCLDQGTDTDLYLYDYPATIQWVAESMDIVVLSSRLQLPAVRPSRRDVEKGQALAAQGFAYGEPFAVFRAGAVAYPALRIEPWTFLRLVLDTPFIPGMSGGPIFDTRGEVVGIVQLSNPYMGSGIGMEIAFKLTLPFWGQQAY